MNTVQLECFVAVAEHLNFSRASEALRISQPSVSHQIQTLEDELGVKLFNRTSKSVALTPEGIRFLPDADLILRTAISARKHLGGRADLTYFEVGCHSHGELNLLPEVFRKLSEEFPLVRPSVRVVPFPSLLGLVENRKLYAAFHIRDSQRKSVLYFKKLADVPIACVCSGEHPLAQHESLTEEMLRGKLVAGTPRQIPNGVLAVQNRLLAGLSPEETYITENRETALTLVRAGLGYTLCPDVAFAREADLRYIPVRDLPSLEFGIYYRYDEKHPMLRRFLAICGERAGV